MKFTSSHNYIKNTSKKNTSVYEAILIEYMLNTGRKYWAQKDKKNSISPGRTKEKKNQDGTYVPETVKEEMSSQGSPFWRSPTVAEEEL